MKINLKSLNNMKNIYKHEQGSFTIEAALVFPTIFILTLGLLFFSLYIHLNVYTYYKASVAAERAAFSWNNSHRDPASGEIDMDYIRTNNDGLYWRTADALSLGSTQQTKLGNALASVNFSGDSQASYTNDIFWREVDVNMSREITAPVFVEGMYGDDRRAGGQAFVLVTDPVDFIRTFDLLYYYLPGVVEDIKGSKQVKDFLSSFTSD